MTFIEHANVTIMVTDLDRAVGFYTGVLGFTLKARYGDHWADIEGPGIAIGLHPTTNRTGVSDNLQIGLRVTDLNGAMKDLRERGVLFLPGPDDNVSLAPFKDPDGNTLYLIQPQW